MVKVIKEIDYPVTGVKCYSIDLTINERGVNNASCSSWVCNGAMKEALILLHGIKVNCRVFSSTNISFYITEEMVNTAWEARKNTEPYTHYAKHWQEVVLDEIKNKFCVPHKTYGMISCSLPSLHCKELPSEIQQAIEEYNK